MSKNHIPKWKLEWYLLGELPTEELEAIAALEQSDSELRDRIAALRMCYAEIRDKYPPAWMARKMGLTFPRTPFRLRWRINLSRRAIPIFACAVLLAAFSMWVFLTDKGGRQPEEAAVCGTRAENEAGEKMAASGLENWREPKDSAEMFATEP
jgi:anti-sigma factor RsiW